MSFKIVNRTEMMKVARKEVSKQLAPYIAKAITKIKNKIKRRVVVYFKRHPVIKGLAGKYPGNEDKDLQAIFGLEDALSAKIIEQILKVVEESIQVTAIRRGGKYQFFIKTDRDLLNRLLTIPDAVYEYEQQTIAGTGFKRIKRINDVSVPWMDWLLNGGDAAADLTFDLDESQQKQSRTGRSIMENRGDGDWTFESRADFITEIGTDPRLIEDAEGIFIREIQKAIDKANE